MSLHPETQRLVNLLPSYWRLRQDPFSVGQQFLRPVAQQLAQLSDWGRRLAAECFLETAPLDLPGPVYCLSLQSYIFQQPQEDPRQHGWRLPQVTATRGAATYPVHLCRQRHELLHLLPTRLSVGAAVPLTAPWLEQQPLTALAQLDNEEVRPPGPVVILTDLAQQAVPFREDGWAVPSFLLTGITDAGQLWEEEILLQAGTWGWSRRSYRRVLRLQPRNFQTLQPALTVGGPATPLPALLDLDLRLADGRDNPQAVWWLQGQALYRGWYWAEHWEAPQLVPETAWQLVDLQGQPLTPDSHAPIPRRPWVAVLAAGKLYFYSKFLRYPTAQELQALQEITDPCLLCLQSDSHWVLPDQECQCWVQPRYGDQLGFSYALEIARPGEDYQPYRPQNGYLVPADTLTWIRSRYDQEGNWTTVFWRLVLDVPGYWRLRLQSYSDTQHYSVDVKLLAALVQRPLAVFDLSALIPQSRRLFPGHRRSLWVADADGYGWPLYLHYDAALVDVEQRTMLLLEPYDTITVQ